MEEVVKYILLNQEKVNRRLMTLLYATTFYAIAVSIRHREQKKKIEKLHDEVEKLKQEKGD